MFRFPSMESLLAFWNSSEYQAIKHLRTDVIPPNFTIAVEGDDYPGWVHSRFWHALLSFCDSGSAALVRRYDFSFFTLVIYFTKLKLQRRVRDFVAIKHFSYSTLDLLCEV